PPHPTRRPSGLSLGQYTPASPESYRGCRVSLIPLPLPLNGSDRLTDEHLPTEYRQVFYQSSRHQRKYLKIERNKPNKVGQRNRQLNNNSSPFSLLKEKFLHLHPLVQALLLLHPVWLLKQCLD